MYHLIKNDTDFLVIYKNEDISFNNEGDDKNSLFSTLKIDFPNDTLYAVHRLDKVTSGILIIAKNQEFAQILSEKFRNSEIEKYYLAISDKKPKKKQGLIKGDLERSRRGTWKLLKTLIKPSATQFFTYSLSEGKRLFLLKPSTGKTHQLRVIMKSLGSPILGDNLYAGSDADRTYLHAYMIKFMLNDHVYMYHYLPKTGKDYLLYQHIVEAIGNPSELSWPKLSQTIAKNHLKS